MSNSWFRDEVRAGRGVESRHGRSVIPGCFTIEATHEAIPAPIGIVWYRWINRQRIDIMGSFVDSRVRRCGVRTFLQRQLIRDYPKVRYISSGAGTKSGRSWMIKNGYERQEGKDWIYKVKRTKL